MQDGRLETAGTAVQHSNQSSSPPVHQSSCPPVNEPSGPLVRRSSPLSLFSSFAFGLRGLKGTKCEAASEHVIHTLDKAVKLKSGVAIETVVKAISRSHSSE